MLYLLYSVMNERYGDSTRLHSKEFYLPIAFTLAVPTAFFFAAFYVEALLVFALVTSLYFGLTRRYWWAAIFAGLATGTKIIGIIAAPMLLILFIEQETILRSGLWTAVKTYGSKIIGIMTVSLSGLLAYMTYLGIRFGDPLIFYKSNKAWGRNEESFSLPTLLGNYAHVLDPTAYGPHINYLVSLSVLIVPIVALAIVAYGIYRKVWWMAAYTFLMIALPLSTGTLMSINRLALVLVPCAVYFAVITPRRFHIYVWLVIALMAVTEAILAAFFLQGSYFIG